MSWTQLGINIDGEAAGDQSGYSVSVSSDGLTVAIGAPFAMNSAGYVKIYQFSAPFIICFPANTPVITSTGEKFIQNITCADKINGKQVHSVVTSIVPKNKMMFIKMSKNSMGINVPNKDTVCTENHMIYYDKMWVPSKLLVNYSTITVFSEPENTLVYNILLVDKNWGIMSVNNLITETLCPVNKIAIEYYKSKQINKILSK